MVLNQRDEKIFGQNKYPPGISNHFSRGPLPFFPGLPSMAKKIQLCHDLLLPPSAPKTSRVPEKARNVGAARLNPGIIFKKRKREKHHPSSSACRLLIYGFSLFICLSLPPMCAYTNGGGAYLVVRGTCDPADHEQEKEKSQHRRMRQFQL